MTFNTLSASRPACISPDAIRAAFSRAMSAMYRQEVPAYGTLIELVAEVNTQVMEHDASVRESLLATSSVARISEERHGAIRLGTPGELAMMRRLFTVMGMYPVSYYDLSVAGIPVHSTAFRPITEEALKANPFRVFTSLLRLDLISDQTLRAEAERVLSTRDIFTPGAKDLILKHERDGGLDATDAERFVAQALETFRWHDKALVPKELYARLHHAHRLIADVVSFKGPHINHLTPRTLDIDEVQRLMPLRGIAPKETIEGPPARTCPVLLRQTSFKALEEAIAFQTAEGVWQAGTHTARFGEIEQRGAALTPKGRALYDHLLEAALITPSRTAEIFQALPDTWEALRADTLAYFEYSLTDKGLKRVGDPTLAAHDIETLLHENLVRADPIIYEDFLPVSAAGIFRSNLDTEPAQSFGATPNRQAFEEALGAAVIDEFALYQAMETASIERCLNAFRPQNT